MKYSFYDLDERIVKTRLALTGAIFEMIKIYPNVKVIDICKKAKVTPMTYYHHFHNKNQLLEFAVKNQLENILPIPQKLKPNNIRQLIAYLLKSFISFINNNYDVINNSANHLLNGSKNQYICILLNNLWFYIEQEIKLIVSNSNRIFVPIWTGLITFGLFFMIFKTNSSTKLNDFSFLWNSLKQLLINL